MLATRSISLVPVDADPGADRFSGGLGTPAGPGLRAAGGTGQTSTPRAYGRSLATAVGLAVTMGLCAGHLDSALIVFKRWFMNPEGYYRIAGDFPWSLPVAHAALMLVPGVVVAILGRMVPRFVTPLVAAWLLATVALWGALLRLPMYTWASLLLAAGLARPVAVAMAAEVAGPRRLRRILAAALVALGVLAAASSGLGALREARSVGALPAPPRSRNLVLIVWDTVRASGIDMYGYVRQVAPNLSRWARRGATYHFAMSPAPWTIPSHSSFFTGRWPISLDTQWKPRFETPDPTLAEYLASRGYQTAGFAANTNCVTRETGLGRGFSHFEDYSASPRSILARTVPGQWLLQRAFELVGDFHGGKWIGLQSRDAAEINGAFLDWLGHRRPDRPFFAFLNYFDAHDPFLAPPEYQGRFGMRPAGPKDQRFLRDYLGSAETRLSKRSITLASDAYDDCIAYLDDQLGRLLAELERRGLLADTDVIITSDHGEAFVEHGTLGHGNSANLEEIWVPLVILSPDAPANRMILNPVSLRDLPATAVDRLGLAEGSPFPGRSLADYWRLPPGQMPAPPTSPAFTEQVNLEARTFLRPQPGRGGVDPGFQMSLLAGNFHYIRDGEGGERLYNPIEDPREKTNLAGLVAYQPVLANFRKMLLDLLSRETGSPEVERTYLRDFRESLTRLVRPNAEPSPNAVDKKTCHSPGSLDP